MEQVVVNFIIGIIVVCSLCIYIGKHEKEATKFVKHLEGDE